MRDVKNIVILNFKTFAQQKTCFILVLLLIALLCVAAVLAANFFLLGGDFIEPISVAVVDLDGEFVTRMILSAITDLSNYSELLDFRFLSQSDAYAALADGNVTAIITLPENFGSAMTTGLNIPFYVQYNADRPFTSSLVQIAADSFADMLRSAQMGVYTVLNYARAYGVSQDDYDRILMAINMNYIGLILNRADMFVVETIYITGALPIWQSYLFAAYIVLMMCAAFALTDALRRNFTRQVVFKLSLRGVGARSLFLSCLISYFLLFLILNIGLLLFAMLFFAALGLPSFAIAWGHIFGVLVILFVMAAFAAMLTFAFRSAFSAGMFAAMLALISLLLSGGIIPTAYFSETLLFAGNFVFNTWGVRLLTAAQLGGSLFVPVLGCLLFAFVFSFIGALKAKF